MQGLPRTVYPKKYAHGFCFAVLCCGYTLTDFPISIRLTSLALWQSNDCPSASKATLMNMDKYFMWIHYERLHNHNKARHNKTVCIFLGIYYIYNNRNNVLRLSPAISIYCKCIRLPNFQISIELIKGDGKRVSWYSITVCYIWSCRPFRSSGNTFCFHIKQFIHFRIPIKSNVIHIDTDWGSKICIWDDA